MMVGAMPFGDHTQAIETGMVQLEGVKAAWKLSLFFSFFSITILPCFPSFSLFFTFSNSKVT